MENESQETKAEPTAQEKVQQSLTKTRGVNKGLVVKDLLEKARGAIQNALPKHLSADRMMKIGYGAISRNPHLLDCEPMSLVKCIVESSELGLEPGGVLGHAYLVPFKNNKTNRREAQLQVGYRGFIELAARSGKVSSIGAEVVYEGDEFDYCLGTERFLKHKPRLRGVNEPLVPICAYATVDYRDGGKDFELLSLQKIEEARKASRSGSGPWVTHWEEMARKTAIRRLAKRLPLSSEIQRVAISDEYREAGIQNDDVSFIESSEE